MNKEKKLNNNNNEPWNALMGRNIIKKNIECTSFGALRWVWGVILHHKHPFQELTVYPYFAYLVGSFSILCNKGVAVKEEPMDSPASQDEEQPPMATVQITPEQLQHEFKQEPADSRFPYLAFNLSQVFLPLLSLMMFSCPCNSLSLSQSLFIFHYVFVSLTIC